MRRWLAISGLFVAGVVHHQVSSSQTRRPVRCHSEVHVVISLTDQRHCIRRDVRTCVQHVVVRPSTSTTLRLLSSTSTPHVVSCSDVNASRYRYFTDTRVMCDGWRALSTSSLIGLNFITLFFLLSAARVVNKWNSQQTTANIIIIINHHIIIIISAKQVMFSSLFVC